MQRTSLGGLILEVFYYLFLLLGFFLNKIISDKSLSLFDAS